MFYPKSFSIILIRSTQINVIQKITVFLTFFMIVFFANLFSAAAQKETVKVEKTGNQNRTQKNKEIILKVFQEVINRQNLSFFDEVYLPNVVDHSAFPDQAPGLKGLKESIKGMFEIWTDLKVTVEDLIAEGDKVATRETWQGTHKPSGKVGKGSVIHIFLIQNGKVSEEWSQGWDWMEKF